MRWVDRLWTGVLGAGFPRGGGERECADLSESFRAASSSCRASARARVAPVASSISAVGRTRLLVQLVQGNSIAAGRRKVARPQLHASSACKPNPIPPPFIASHGTRARACARRRRSSTRTSGHCEFGFKWRTAYESSRALILESDSKQRGCDLVKLKARDQNQLNDLPSSARRINSGAGCHEASAPGSAAKRRNERTTLGRPTMSEYSIGPPRCSGKP